MPRKGEKMSPAHRAAMIAGQERARAERKARGLAPPVTGRAAAKAAKLAKQAAAREARNAARSEELADAPKTGTGRRGPKPRGPKPHKRTTKSPRKPRHGSTPLHEHIHRVLDALTAVTNILDDLEPNTQQVVLHYVARHYELEE